MKNTNVKKGGDLPRVRTVLYNEDELDDMYNGFNAIAKIIKEKKSDFALYKDKASKFAQLWYLGSPIKVKEITGELPLGIKKSETTFSAPMEKESIQRFHSGAYNDYATNRSDFYNNRHFNLKVLFYSQVLNQIKDNEIVKNFLGKIKSPYGKDYELFQIGEKTFVEYKEDRMCFKIRFEKYNKDIVDFSLEELKDEYNIIKDLDSNVIYWHISDMPIFKESKISINNDKSKMEEYEQTLKRNFNEYKKDVKEKIEELEKNQSGEKNSLLKLVEDAKIAFNELVSQEKKDALDKACKTINNNRKSALTSALVDLLNICLHKQVTIIGVKDDKGDDFKFGGSIMDNLNKLQSFLFDKTNSNSYTKEELLNGVKEQLSKSKIEYLVDNINTIFDYRFIPELNKDNRDIDGIHKLHKLKDNKNKIQISFENFTNPFQFKLLYGNKYKKHLYTKIPTFCDGENKFNNNFYDLVQYISGLLDKYHSKLSDDDKNVSGGKKSRKTRKARKSRKTRRVKKAKKVVKRKTRRVKKAKKVVKRKTRKTRRVKRG